MTDRELQRDIGRMDAELSGLRVDVAEMKADVKALRAAFSELKGGTRTLLGVASIIGAAIALLVQWLMRK